MVLPADASIFERCQLIQRDVVGDLPALNESGSPKLGTFCRLNDGTYWCVVVSDVAPPHNLIWEQVGGGGGLSLPDQRFTVGRGAYNLNPNPATFTTIAAGIAAALAGTGTTLGAASSASQRFVWILPDQYNEAITLRPYVHLEGAGGAAESSRLIGNVTYNGGNGYVVVRNVHFTGSTIDVAPTAGSKLVLVFENCTFEGVTWSLTTLGGDAPTDVTLLFNGCEGQIVSATFTVAAGDLLVHQYVGLPSTGTGSFAANRGIRFESTPTYTGAGGVIVGIMGGQRLIANGAGGPMLRFTGTVTGSVVTDDCLLYTGNLQASVFGNTSANMATWLCRSGTRVAITPRSYWNTSTSAHFEGGQLEVLIPTTNDASVPLDAVSGGTVTASLYPSNRERFVQDFNFVVPASQTGGGGPYGSAAAAVAAMTVNNLLGINAYADTYRIVVDYANLNADPADPASANFATTFRYASFLLKDPTLLEDGRLYVVKNDTNPNGNGAGPIALRLPNGTTANVEHLVSDASVNGTFTTADYVILDPGQAVILEVDRNSPSAPAYAVIAVVDALPGIPPAPDQRFTVGKAAYALNAPGTNTFVSPEDGIAAAQVGTGTALGVASAASQRFVWIMPDTYAAPLKAVDLIPYVHLEGSSGAAESTILSGYTLQYLSHGYLSLTGLQLTNCVLNLTPDDDSTIVISGCHFVGATINLSSAQGKTTTLKLEGCSGTVNLVHNSSGSVKVEIAGTGASTLSSTTSPTFVESMLTFPSPIQCLGGGTTYIAIRAGANIRYDGLRLANIDGSTLYISTLSSTIECGVGSTSIFTVVNAGQIDWQCLLGTQLAGGQVTTFFDVDATSSAFFEGGQFTQYPYNTAVPSSLLNPVSGGTVSSLSIGSGIFNRLNFYNINVIPGQTVAQQSTTYEDGYADCVTVVANYQGSAPLQPDTTLAGRCFGSLIIPDPLYVPEGKEVTILNTGNPASGDSAFAIRLPSGTTSRIGNKVSDVSVNPVFTPDNYYILYPGQSIKLMALQSAVAPPRYEVSAINAPQPPQEPSWLDEAMGQYTVLPVPTAGTSTTGALFFARRTGVYCNGGRFYWGGAAARTIRVTLWKSGVGAVATVNVAVAGAGIYTGRFASPYPIDGASNWFITFWETTGTEYQQASNIPNGTLRYPSGIQQREYQYVTIVRGDVFGSGNVIPNLSSGATVYYLIEPLISVFRV